MNDNLHTIDALSKAAWSNVFKIQRNSVHGGRLLDKDLGKGLTKGSCVLVSVFKF